MEDRTLTLTEEEILHMVEALIQYDKRLAADQDCPANTTTRWKKYYNQRLVVQRIMDKLGPHG